METGKKKFAVVGVITGVVVILIITLVCFLAKPSESQDVSTTTKMSTTTTTTRSTSTKTSTVQDFLFLTPTLTYEMPSFRLSTPCPIPQHPHHLVQGAVAGLYSGSLLICGGEYASGTLLSSCHTLSNQTWVQTDSLPAPTDYAAVSQSSGGILVTGGGNYSSYSNHTQTYSGAGWTRGPDLPVKVAEHCQVDIGGEEVIISGGWIDWSSSARVFSLQGGRWTELPPMNTSRQGHACAVVQNQLWVIGGYGTATVEIMDITTKVWRNGPDLPREMYGGQAVVYNGELYAVHNEGQVWRLTKDVWETVATITGYEDRPIQAVVVNIADLC